MPLWKTLVYLDLKQLGIEFFLNPVFRVLKLFSCTQNRFKSEMTLSVFTYYSMSHCSSGAVSSLTNFVLTYFVVLFTNGILTVHIVYRVYLERITFCRTNDEIHRIVRMLHYL